MIISKLVSGLGNQLFQYAVSRQLSLTKRTALKLDTSFFSSQNLRSFKLHHYAIVAKVATEEHATFPLSPYGITKLAIEKCAHLYYENRGSPVVRARPSNVFGAHQRPYIGQGFIATAIASILDERELTLFEKQGTLRDHSRVDDVARGIVAALLYGIPGEVYNIGSEACLTNRQIINKLIPLAIEFGRDVKVHILPARPFDVPVNILDCNKLCNQAGWVPEQVFDSALRRTWDWYADEIRK